MKTSDSIKHISEALSKFQKDVGIVHKDATNPFHKKKYATLLSSIEASTDALEKHGLAVVQGAVQGAPELATRVVHSSGEWIETYTPMVWDKPTMQNVGSAWSYARRYGWQAALALAASDDDGNAASGMHTDIPDFKPPTAKVSGNLGDTKIPIGVLKGKLFKEVSMDDIASMAKWCSDKPNFKDLFEKATAYLAESQGK